MDQNHCKVPYLGTQNSFNNPVKKTIVGVKMHGHGFTIYRAFNTVNKGSDLTSYCILDQLEIWKKKYKQYPEKLYLQVDGGSENANKYVLALLELLVIKRVCSVIYYSRLPTGHTHEDIDGCFGVISFAFRSDPCETLEYYVEVIEKCFKKENMKGTVKDVYLVPDLQSLLGDCIDPKLKNLHRELDTQHQWRFEAKDPDHWFKLGCKTTYRAYCSDQVVEIHEMPMDQCFSEIGRVTGLEPSRVYCTWQPAPDADPVRQVEGISILQKLPNWIKSTAAPFYPPCDIPPGTTEANNATVREIEQKYSASSHYENSIVLDSWRKWKSEFAPVNDVLEDYISLLKTRGNFFNKAYRFPLRDYILKADSKVHDRTIGNRITSPLERSKVIINKDFVWPSLLAAAMASVQTSFTPDPPEPRLYVNNDPMLKITLEKYDACTLIYHSTDLPGRLSSLEALLHSKVGYSGKIPSLEGTLLYCRLFQFLHCFRN